jgi:hypothetical protein
MKNNHVKTYNFTSVSYIYFLPHKILQAGRILVSGDSSGVEFYIRVVYLLLTTKNLQAGRILVSGDSSGVEIYIRVVYYFSAQKILAGWPDSRVGG